MAIMYEFKATKWFILSIVIAGLSACGKERLPANEGEFRRDFDSTSRQNAENNRESIFGLFRDNADPNVTLKVNKYLWKASLDVLNFMPIEAADPFTGTIALGFGRPQGGGAAYRATVFITDPALEARSLRVALQGANGQAVSTTTQRAVEDAILTRARQLRIADGKL
ncbi:MAG: DUF3576 domain-containing protein [Litoreibacter sp.]